MKRVTYSWKAGSRMPADRIGDRAAKGYRNTQIGQGDCRGHAKRLELAGPKKPAGQQPEHFYSRCCITNKPQGAAANKPKANPELRLTGRRVHLVCVHQLHRELAIGQALPAEAGVALQQHVRVGVVHRVHHL